MGIFHISSRKKPPIFYSFIDDSMAAGVKECLTLSASHSKSRKFVKKVYELKLEIETADCTSFLLFAAADQ